MSTGRAWHVGEEGGGSTLDNGGAERQVRVSGALVWAKRASLDAWRKRMDTEVRVRALWSTALLRSRGHSTPAASLWGREEATSGRAGGGMSKSGKRLRTVQSSSTNFGPDAAEKYT